MTGYSPTAANQALNALDGGAVNVLGFVQLYTSDPGATGTAGEATSARQATAWGAAAGRVKTNTTALTFTGQSASTPHTHFGTWSAATGGTFGISGALASPVTSGTITIAAGALSITD